MYDSIRTGLAFPGPVRFLSDLHLGHDMCTLRRTAELWPLIDGAGTVVFNGDTTEDLATSFYRRSMDMLGELQDLCRRAGAQTIMVNGNHDPDCWPHDWLDFAGGRLFITHGHVLLRLISPWSRKLRNCREQLERIHSEYSAEQYRVMETRFAIARRSCLAMPPTETRQQGHSLAARISLFVRETWPPARPWEVLKVWAGMPSMAAAFLDEFRPAARVMLFGHTHRAAIWRKHGRLLVNTGGFVTFARPLLAEWHDERLSVFKVKVDSGEQRMGRQIASQRLEG